MDISAIRKKILLWEILGIIFTISIGSLLHFTFELSGEWTPMAIISGVNESTWEHFIVIQTVNSDN